MYIWAPKLVENLAFRNTEPVVCLVQCYVDDLEEGARNAAIVSYGLLTHGPIYHQYGAVARCQFRKTQFQT